MSHFFQNCYFSVYSVDVRLVFYFVFFENLNCNFVASYPMRALFDLSESALALGLADDEAADVLAFGILFFFVRWLALAGFFLGFLALFIIIFLFRIFGFWGDLYCFLAVHVHVLVGSLIRWLIAFFFAAFGRYDPIFIHYFSRVFAHFVLQ